MVVVPTAEILAKSGNRSWHGSIGGYVALGAFFLAIAAVGLLLARRLAKAGLWMGADGVVVRNPLRTITVALHDVESFQAGVAAGSGNGTPCPLLRRTHGTSIGVWALGREGVVWHFARYESELQPLCDELNETLRILQRQA